ncbi:PIN domain-containing protein [Engelhardtia mirabilis]|uniref:PIN domain-containing protein n=1 Tax=Engelhardtia mirabilis TaxID=2528011 RepID=A0A518BT41_9BACT|nr:hypothetical protein Pla133_52670 [Planctomycetes bacterium Pla133]QDV04471.1 hypothetical protein Pla86_52670 [Planctomycetes bacterium Pla86]
MRVFLDANVLFSASNAGSATQRLIALGTARAQLITSELAILEARKNLRLKRPSWLEAFETLRESIDIVPTVVFGLQVKLASKDVPLLCAAIRAEADLFVTGDRLDFGHLLDEVVHGVRIISPLGLAERLLE